MAKKTTKTGKPAATAGLDKHEGHVIERDATTTVLYVFGLGRDVGIVSVTRYQNQPSLDLRRFYLDEAEDKYRPTGKGVRIPKDTVVDVLDQLDEQRDRILTLLEG